MLVYVPVEVEGTVAKVEDRRRITSGCRHTVETVIVLLIANIKQLYHHGNHRIME